MRTNNEIIELLDELRLKQNISISELARRVGMAKSAVSRYFNKTREFPLNRLDDFSNALGVSSKFILGFSTPEPFDISTNNLYKEITFFTDNEKEDAFIFLKTLKKNYKEILLLPEKYIHVLNSKNIETLELLEEQIYDKAISIADENINNLTDEKIINRANKIIELLNSYNKFADIEIYSAALDNRQSTININYLLENNYYTILSEKSYKKENEHKYPLFFTPNDVLLAKQFLSANALAAYDGKSLDSLSNSEIIERANLIQQTTKNDNGEPIELDKFKERMKNEKE